MAGKRDDGTRKPGIPTKLTLPRLKAIVTTLVAGNYIGTACEFAGISRTSYNDWQLRGELEVDRVRGLRGVNVEEILESFEGTDPKTGADRSKPEYWWANRPAKFRVEEWPFVVFQQHVLRAKAAAEVRALHMVNKAMGDSWQAAAWFLERTRPDLYGRRERISHEGPTEGSPVKVVTVSEVEEKLNGLLGDD